MDASGGHAVAQGAVLGTGSCGRRPQRERAAGRRFRRPVPGRRGRRSPAGRAVEGRHGGGGASPPPAAASAGTGTKTRRGRPPPHLKEGKQTDVIIMDFAKAFDKVSHWRLILKLKNYGITGQLNHWIEDFLHQRSQRVVCNGEHSNWAPVLSGVPQGSVIGPILFLIYINDLPEDIRSTVRLFADDTIMYMTMSGASDAASLQEDLDRLAAWENKWKMQFTHKNAESFA